MGRKSEGLPFLSVYDRLSNSVVAMEDDTILRRVQKLVDTLTDNEKKWYLFSSAWDIS